MIYFSATLNGFIPAEWRLDGTYNINTWPTDAVLLSDKESDKYWKVTPVGGKILGSVSGRPAWVDLPPLTAEEVESQKLAVIAQAKLKKSKLISDARDEIDVLKDRIEFGQDRAAELKLWKSYRIALDDIDVSAAPDIMWPVVPEQ